MLGAIMVVLIVVVGSATPYPPAAATIRGELHAQLPAAHFPKT
jgi:hypothetical protein